MAPDQAVPRREQVYAQLKAKLMRGDFAAHDRLSEERIASGLGVSRTPVREAFARLYADRLLRRHDDGGYYVAEPDLIGLRDLYELRITLELRGLTRALEGAESHDTEILENVRDDWRAIRQGQPAPDPQFVETEESFHVELSRSAGNKALTESLVAVNARIRPVRMYDFLTEDRIEATIHQHLEIVETLLAGDVQLSVQLMRSHVGESMDVVEKRATRALTQMLLRRQRQP